MNEEVAFPNLWNTRIRNALDRAGIHSFEALSQTNEGQLLNLKNFGLTSLIEVKRALEKRGLSLGMPKNQESRKLEVCLRDYFASAAMTGWLAGFPSELAQFDKVNGPQIIAEFAYDVADAMIKQRTVSGA